MSVSSLSAYRYNLFGKMGQAFPAFKYRNYRLYFSGQLVSLIGTWLQTVAQQWLVLQLTNSALWVGIITALSTLPVLFFGLFGGVIVDRFSTRRVLIFTNAAQLVCALILGILAVTGTVAVWHIAVLAFALGVVSSLDMPARQSFAVELVDKVHLSSAIALNSTTFNGARIIGPALAGLCIAILGTGGAFILNAISFIPAILALLAMHLQKHIPKETKHPLKEIKDGITYALGLPSLRVLLVFAGMLAVFGWTYTTILPIIAQNIFHTGASGLGFLNTAAGVGAIGAAIFVSTFGKKMPGIYVILLGNLIFGLSIFFFSLTHVTAIGLALLVATGFGLLTQFAVMNTMIQLMVEDHIRGRILSIYTIMFMGFSPLGSFQIGFVGEHFGPQLALRLNAIVILLCGVVLFFFRKRLLDAAHH